MERLRMSADSRSVEADGPIRDDRESGTHRDACTMSQQPDELDSLPARPVGGGGVVDGWFFLGW
jgi:hypothetical protein